MYVGLHVYPPHDLGQMSLKLCYLYSSHFSEVVLRMFLYTLKCAFVQYREMAIADIIYKAAGMQTNIALY